MRTLLRDKGISAVRFAIAGHWSEVAGLLADFTLPVVVKPTTLSASRGTYLLTDPADLPAWGESLTAYQYEGPLLVEEYLRGPEFSVETLTVGGEHHVVGVTRKLLGPLPHFVERGHLFGAAATEETSRVAALAVELLDAVGYQCGPAHTEIILTPDGPRIVESQARLGGDKIPDIIQIARGFDIKRAMFARPRGPGAPGWPGEGRRAHRLPELPKRGSAVGVRRRRGTRLGFRPHAELPVLGRGRAA